MFKTFIKRKLIILMFIVVLVWVIYTSLVFWDQVMLWVAVKINGEMLFSQFIFYLIKNIPSCMSFFIAQRYWNEDY